MNIVDLIIKKRDGGRLTKEEIEFFVNGVVDSSIPDYQVSAMLMAIYFQNLDNEETSELTMQWPIPETPLTSHPLRA